MSNLRKKKLSVRVFFSVIGTVICFFPFWFWLTVYLVVGPVELWENVVLFGAGLFFLGSIQTVCVILLVAWLRVVFVYDDLDFG